MADAIPSLFRASMSCNRTRAQQKVELEPHMVVVADGIVAVDRIVVEVEVEVVNVDIQFALDYYLESDESQL